MTKTIRSLADLKPLARELTTARLAVELQRERLAATLRLAEQERRVFELTVGPVTPLSCVSRVLHERELPPPEPQTASRSPLSGPRSARAWGARRPPVPAHRERDRSCRCAKAPWGGSRCGGSTRALG